MKRPNADEISRWLMDDTLVMEGYEPSKFSWQPVINPTAWNVIRVSIATVEGEPVFDEDTYYNEYGQERTAHIGLTDSWDNCTITLPMPKSILDSEEFNNLAFQYWHVAPSYNSLAKERLDKLKQFIRDHKGEI